jgi:hypothetical protein
MKHSNATLEKHMTILQRLAARHHGKLPSYTWLNAHGYFGSYDKVRAAGLLRQFRRRWRA